MSRLPIPGQDDDVWGEILNDFLVISHNNDDTLQSAAITTAGGYVKPANGIPSTDLSDTVQSSLTLAAGQTRIFPLLVPDLGLPTRG